MAEVHGADSAPNSRSFAVLIVATELRSNFRYVSRAKPLVDRFTCNCVALPKFVAGEPEWTYESCDALSVVAEDVAGVMASMGLLLTASSEANQTIGLTLRPERRTKLTTFSPAAFSAFTYFVRSHSYVRRLESRIVLLASAVVPEAALLLNVMPVSLQPVLETA